VQCSAEHAKGEPNVIAVCVRCGLVEEYPLPALASLLKENRRRGFHMAGSAVEVAGLCRGCCDDDI